MLVCCVNCFENEFIRELIFGVATVADCSYCDSSQVNVAPLEQVGGFIREAVLRCYEKAPIFPGHSFGFSSYISPICVLFILRNEEEIFSDALLEKGSDASQIDLSNFQGGHLLNDLLEASAPMTSTVTDIFRDRKSHTDLVLKREDSSRKRDKYTLSWENFKYYVTHYCRYFNFSAEGVVREEIIKPVRECIRNLVVELPEETSLWRSRVKRGYPSDEDNATGELGPAPIRVSSNNRMSPSGISYIYLGEDKETCIAEIRPLVGDFVWSGAFKTTRKLQIVDLAKVTPTGLTSLFDPDFTPDIKRIPNFLASFAHDISKPVSPNDAELEFVPTQVICEYIRAIGYHGIRFRSSLFNYKDLGGGPSTTMCCFAVRRMKRKTTL